MTDFSRYEQMCGAPSDAYSAGEWCEAANGLLARLREVEERLILAEAALRLHGVALVPANEETADA